MKPLLERQVRASFVNCTKGEASRLTVPRDLATWQWDDLELLGWHEPSDPRRAYLVAELDEQVVGLVLRVAAPSGRSRQAVCSLCLATHTGDGVSLMTAPRAGRSGRQGDSVGAYVCTDLGCSAHVRGRGRKGGPPDVETMSTEDKVTRLRGNLELFLDRVGWAVSRPTA
ncbi:FBP domain-containing protein [Angustibacter aerolatus]